MQGVPLEVSPAPREKGADLKEKSEHLSRGCVHCRLLPIRLQVGSPSSMPAPGTSSSLHAYSCSLSPHECVEVSPTGAQ